jgi:hypothetical protein
MWWTWLLMYEKMRMKPRRHEKKGSYGMIDQLVVWNLEERLREREEGRLRVRVCLRGH